MLRKDCISQPWLSDYRLDKDIRNHCDRQSKEDEMIECAKCGETVPEDKTFTDFEDTVGGRTCNKCTKELMAQEEDESNKCDICGQDISICKC